MKERPILFAGPMVRAILDGRKTQTRRVMNPSPSLDPLSHDYAVRAMVGHADDLPGKPFGVSFLGDRGMSNHQRCRYGEPGDRLWVRETWGLIRVWDDEDGDLDDWSEKGYPKEKPQGWATPYAADEHPSHFEDRGFKWRPSIHMPRWASRLTLEVTEVRVQRLQHITEADAKAEGTGPCACEGDVAEFIGCAERKHHHGFAAAWEAINGKRAPWNSNPWVWAITFQRVA